MILPGNVGQPQGHVTVSNPPESSAAHMSLRFPSESENLLRWQATHYRTAGAGQGVCVCVCVCVCVYVCLCVCVSVLVHTLKGLSKDDSSYTHVYIVHIIILGTHSSYIHTAGEIA